MKKLVVFTFLWFFTFSAYADLNDCTDIYVGSMFVHKADGLNTIVFLNSPVNSSGSYATFMTGWSSEARKEAMSLLTAAKISGHKVYIQTEAEDKCSITSPGQVLTLVALRNNK